MQTNLLNKIFNFLKGKNFIKSKYIFCKNHYKFIDTYNLWYINILRKLETPQPTHPSHLPFCFSCPVSPQLPHLLTILCEPFLLTLPPCLHEFCAKQSHRRMFRYHFARTMVGNENEAPPTKCWVNSCRGNWDRATRNIYLPSDMIFAHCW